MPPFLFPNPNTRGFYVPVLLFHPYPPAGHRKQSLPLPDRLRLLAECVEDGRTPYIDAVSGLLLESAARIESQLEQLRALCHLLPAQAEREVRHA